MEDYTNREIDGKFEQVNDKLDEQTQHLVDIKVQTTKTNGRITKLEEFMFIAKGAIAMLTALVVPVALFVLYQIIIKGLR